MMKNFNFNEKQDIESMISQGYVDESDYKITIGKLALYNLKVLNLKREDNYDAIKEYMELNARDFFEAEHQKIIYREIANAKKRILRDISCVNITKSELDKISSLNDIRKEKIAFVLVATAKYYDAIKGVDIHYTNLTNSELCKMARITMRTVDRNSFITFIYDNGVVERHIRPDSTGKKVLFISDNENDEVILSLSEIDFQELAYVYLNWKNGCGFTRCKVCGRIMKSNKNNTKLYCEACSKVVKREQDRVAYEKRKIQKVDTHQND